jgi:hypothetical protein
MRAAVPICAAVLAEFGTLPRVQLRALPHEVFEVLFQLLKLVT